MHGNKEKTNQQCLRARIAYIVNPAKTNGGVLVSSYACAPETADAEFALSKREYRMVTGRQQEGDVLAYQIRQSFMPGEVTPEEANRMGCEFADRFLKGNHAYIVATHVDRHHVHNHILWNSTTLDCTRKFRNFFWSTLAVRRLSDMICAEHGKSIIDHPQGKGKSYDAWLGDGKKPSHREALREAIDDALTRKPDSFEELLSMIEKAGYEIKRGKQPSFRKAGQKRRMRLDTLGEAYREEALRAVIAGNREHPIRKKRTDRRAEKRMSLLIDVQAKLAEGKGAGYARWAKVFNAKQLAKTITYLSENGFENMEALRAKADEASAKVHVLSEENRQQEQRLRELSELRTQVIHYMRTREVFEEYKRCGYSRAFLEAHEMEIAMHREAKRYFNAHEMKRLPTGQKLKEEYDRLKAQKGETYREYQAARDEMREILVVRENVERIMREKGGIPNERENER